MSQVLCKLLILMVNQNVCFARKTLYGLSDLDDSWQRNAARGHTTFVTLRAVSFLSSLI